MRFQQANGLQQDGIVSQKICDMMVRQADTHRLNPPVRVEPTPEKREEMGRGVWSEFSLDGLPGLQIVITAHNAGPWITDCLLSVKRAMRHLKSGWKVLVADDSSTDHTYALVSELNGQFPSLTIKRFPKSRSVGAARNKAISMAMGDSTREFPAICMVDADDTLSEDHGTLLRAMVDSGSLAVFGDYFKGNELVIAAPENQVRGNIKCGAVMFHHSLIPGNGALFREDLEINEEAALWMSWFKREINMKACPGTVVYNYNIHDGSASNPLDLQFKEAALKKWASIRTSIMDAGTSICEPLVSCLMLTGKCPERLPLARVAIRCFLDQTWHNKQLVIINHGDTPLSTGDPRVVEVMTTKGPDVSLGDLRNMSIDAASGEWCVQWDDDDWHHPTRIAQQMKEARHDALVTYLWQIRLNLVTGSAFYDKMEGGQHMSVLFHRSVAHRYLKLERAEDTAFVKSFSRIIAIDNSILNPFTDPLQYVRTYHGRNIWDASHIMRGSDQKNVDHPAEMKLTEYHADKVRGIIETYQIQPGYTAGTNV